LDPFAPKPSGMSKEQQVNPFDMPVEKAVERLQIPSAPVGSPAITISSPSVHQSPQINPFDALRHSDSAPMESPTHISILSPQVGDGSATFDDDDFSPRGNIRKTFEDDDVFSPRAAPPQAPALAIDTTEDAPEPAEEAATEPASEKEDYLDEHNEFSIELDRDSEKGLGIVLSSEGEAPEERIWVDCILEGTPAASETRIRVGDLIVAVNDENVEEHTLDQTIKLLGADHIALTFRRDANASVAMRFVDIDELKAESYFEGEDLRDLRDFAAEEAADVANPSEFEAIIAGKDQVHLHLPATPPPRPPHVPAHPYPTFSLHAQLPPICTSPACHLPFLLS
jgi:hypothetical protein